MNIDALFDKIVSGDRVAPGQAMTLVESERPDDRVKAIQLLEKCEERLDVADMSLRIAVSGAPGAGKSSLIETMGLKAIDKGHKVGVITIDPTSSLSRGSILGDKSRMAGLSGSTSAFVRSSPAGDVLGGLGRRSQELITILAAVGYDLILIETVGVGQSEHMAWQLTDGFMLVIAPGGGDELQGIKRGITELADLVVINKADGHLEEQAKVAGHHYSNALHYFTPLRKDWQPKALICSALTGVGVDELLSSIESYGNILFSGINRHEIRVKQKSAWLTWNLGIEARKLLLGHPEIHDRMEAVHARLEEKNISIFSAAYAIEQVMHTLIKPSADHNKS